MEKNPQYWNAANTKLNSIRIPHITNDANTLFNLFQSSEIAFTELSRETLPQALQQRLYIQSFLNGMLNYMEFNFREESPLRNHALREAISLVIDRQSLVNKVIAAPGTRPHCPFFSSMVTRSGANSQCDTCAGYWPGNNSIAHSRKRTGHAGATTHIVNL
jgi:ABC-type oligopeptide transport system substrate-binding subunit